MDKIQFVTTSKNKIKQATAAPLVDLKFPPFGWSTFSIQEGRNRCLLLHSCSILEIDKTFSPFFLVQMHACTLCSARPNSCNIGMFRVPPVPYLLYRKVREQFVN